MTGDLAELKRRFPAHELLAHRHEELELER